MRKAKKKEKKKTTKNNAEKDMVELKTGLATLDISVVNSQKFKNTFNIYDPAILFFGMSTNYLAWYSTNTCSKMLISVLIIIARKKEESKCLSTVE